MKKALCAVLAFALMLGLTGCGGESKGGKWDFSESDKESYAKGYGLSPKTVNPDEKFYIEGEVIDVVEANNSTSPPLAFTIEQSENYGATQNFFVDYSGFEVAKGEYVRVYARSKDSQDVDEAVSVYADYIEKIDKSEIALPNHPESKSPEEKLTEIENLKSNAVAMTLQDLENKKASVGEDIKIDGIIAKITEDDGLKNWGVAMPNPKGEVDIGGTKFGYCTVSPLEIEEEYSEGDVVTIYGQYIGEDTSHQNIPWVMARAVEKSK